MNIGKWALFLSLGVLGITLNVYYHWDYLWTIWAKNYLQNQDIVFSFTTTPERIQRLEEPLHCLSKQNIPVRQIFISLPHVFKRTNSTYVIPEWLEVYPNVTILRTEDYGPATKILGTLKHPTITDDTIIIAIDDDTCYAPNLAIRLATRAKQYPDQVIAVSGAELDFNKNKAGGIVKVFKDKTQVTVVEGFGGIAYRRRFFKPSIYEIRNEPQFCFTSDDIYLSFHLAKNNVPRQSLNNKFLDVRDHVRQIQFGFMPDALYRLGNSQAERYKQCITYLQTKYPTVVFNANGIN